MTSPQTLAHFLRHENGRPQVTQVLEGSVALVYFAISLANPAKLRHPTAMSETFTHRRTSRNATSYLMVTFAIVGLLVLMFGLQAHPFVVALFAVLIAPAIWSIIANTEARLSIDENSVSWQVGARGDRVDLDEIDYVRARTALDLSQRVAIFRNSGPKLHIPGPCLPSGRQLDEALEARGVKVKRLF